MASGSEAPTSGEYIQHHLQNLTFGQHPDGSWGFAHGAEEAAAMGFWAFHADTVGWSLFLGLVFYFLFRKAAKKADAGVPSRFQAAIESIVEFVDGNVKEYEGVFDLLSLQAALQRAVSTKP